MNLEHPPYKIPSIELQLSRILKSPHFKRSPILRRFLEFVVHETLKGNSETLKEYVIAINVLNKSTDFNPQTDGIVRIHANRLRKSLEAYYQREGLNDRILISVPIGRYIPHFERKKDRSATGSGSTENLVEARERKPKVAVIPFEILSGDDKVEVVCSVLCHDLTLELSRFSEIGVISNYSVQHVLDKKIDIEDLVSDLDIDYLISGYCLKENDSIRVNIELNGCRNHKLIWAESYHLHDLSDDSLTGYKRIIQKVVAMTCGFFGLIYRNTLNDHVPTSYDSLYAIYWHNRYHKEFTNAAFKETLQAVEIGLEKKPGDALLTALKAELYLNLYVMQPVFKDSYLKKGTKLAKKAIGLDTTCQHAHQVHVWSNILNREGVEIDRSIQKCLSINPNDPMYLGQMGFGLICAGDYEKGLEMMSRSLDLNPYYPWNLNIGFAVYFLHQDDYEEALLWAEKINRKGFLWDPLIKAAILGLIGREEEAQAALQDLMAISTDFVEQPQQVIQTFILDPNLVRKLDQGLLSAGLRGLSR